MIAGRAQKFERGGGGGCNLKPSVFRPKSSKEQKKRSTRSQMSNVPPKVKKRAKKKVIKPSDCPLITPSDWPQRPPGYAPERKSCSEEYLQKKQR